MHQSAFMNQTGPGTINGPHWTGPLNYSNNPAGINPQYTRYLSETGVGDNGDPLSTVDVKALAGGNFGNFWKIIFPMGNNDCDLQAAIANITDKINQFDAMMHFPGDLHAYVKQPSLNRKGGGCPGCQGDAFAYVSNSIGTLKTIMSQYQNAYNSHVKTGGGCSYGMTAANYEAYQTAAANAAQQLEIQKQANQQAQENSVKQAEAAAAAEHTIALQTAADSGMQGQAAANAANAATGMSTSKMLLYGGIAVVVLGGMFVVISRSHKSQ